MIHPFVLFISAAVTVWLYQDIQEREMEERRQHQRRSEERLEQQRRQLLQEYEEGERTRRAEQERRPAVHWADLLS